MSSITRARDTLRRPPLTQSQAKQKRHGETRTTTADTRSAVLVACVQLPSPSDVCLQSCTSRSRLMKSMLLVERAVSSAF
eukprot:5461890-Prymnesium_polylepis.1